MPERCECHDCTMARRDERMRTPTLVSSLSNVRQVEATLLANDDADRAVLRAAQSWAYAITQREGWYDGNATPAERALYDAVASAQKSQSHPPSSAARHEMICICGRIATHP